jgi:hypothetical protein
MDKGMGIAQLFADVSAAATELHEAIRREDLIASGYLHDPIFPAIERHKMLHQRFEDICRRTDEAVAEQEAASSQTRTGQNGNLPIESNRTLCKLWSRRSLRRRPGSKRRSNIYRKLRAGVNRVCSQNLP